MGIVDGFQQHQKKEWANWRVILEKCQMWSLEWKERSQKTVIGVVVLWSMLMVEMMVAAVELEICVVSGAVRCQEEVLCRW